MTSPRVSVVIPTYNRAADLDRALRSVREQTFQDFEVIIVDNHSTDDTVGVIERFADARFHHRLIANGGIIAKSRNRGIAEARGEYVAFLDSDDWWTPRKLELSVAALDAGADLVYHHLYLATRADQRVYLRRVRAFDVQSPVFDALLYRGAAIPQSSVVMRRATLHAIGGIPEDATIVGAEDYVCWTNAARVTERFQRIPGTHGYYWAGGGNLSSDTRTLDLIDRLAARFSTELTDSRRVPVWFSYARGLAYYRTGRLDEARRNLSHVVGPDASRRMRVRSLATRALIAVRAPGQK